MVCVCVCLCVFVSAYVSVCTCVCVCICVRVCVYLSVSNRANIPFINLHCVKTVSLTCAYTSHRTAALNR